MAMTLHWVLTYNWWGFNFIQHEVWETRPLDTKLLYAVETISVRMINYPFSDVKIKYRVIFLRFEWQLTNKRHFWFPFLFYRGENETTI